MTEGGFSQPSSIERERLLLVEGKDDENFFRKFIEVKLKKNAGKSIQVLSYGGKENFVHVMKLLPAIRKKFRAIGVICDADLDAMAAFQSVCTAIAGAGLPAPGQHAGYSQSHPKTGVFIMPDGTHNGELETLCRWSCAGDEKSACVEDYIKCLKDKQILDNAKEDKTFAHSYIASTKKPEVSVGVSAQRSVWDFSSPVFDSLTDFTKRLSEI